MPSSSSENFKGGGVWIIYWEGERVRGGGERERERERVSNFKHSVIYNIQHLQEHLVMLGTLSATRPPWLYPGGLPDSSSTMELSVDTMSTSQKCWQAQECTSICQLPRWPCPPYTHTMSMSTQWLHTLSVWDHTPASIECKCLKMVNLELHIIITVEPLYNGHHWDQGFVLYSEVSFAQVVIVDHTPLTIMHGQLCWSKTVDHDISCTD